MKIIDGMKKSYFQVIINFYITLLRFCFGSFSIGYNGFDCITERIECVLKESV